MTLITVFVVALVAVVLFIGFMHYERVRGKRFFGNIRQRADHVMVHTAKRISDEAPRIGGVLAKRAAQRARNKASYHFERLHRGVKKQTQRAAERVRTNGVKVGNKPASAFLRDVAAHKQILRQERTGEKKPE